MRNAACLLLITASCALAQQSAPARHIIRDSGALTAPSARPAATIAREFVAAQAQAAGLNAAAVDGMYVSKQYTDEHNGVTHIVYRQRFRGFEVVNAAYSVNLDREGRILNAGGDLAPAPEGSGPALPGLAGAVRSALASVNPRAAETYNASPSMQRSVRSGAVRFTEVLPNQAPEGKLVWYRSKNRLLPAYDVFTTAEDGVTNYRVIVDADGNVLRQIPMTFFQKPKGLVFERESPQPNPQPGTLLLKAPPFVDRTEQSFEGDPKASPAGWVYDNQTWGNNVIAGQNLLGLQFWKGVVPTRTTENDFSFPLQVGPGAPGPLNFADAVNTNLFYWMNRAHDLHYASGFTEAAGNFQFDNFGRGGTAGDGIYAYSHFGATARQFASTDNAYFTTFDDADGAQSMIAMFVASGAGDQVTDGSLDAAVMVHEYTHGVTNRLLPSGYDAFQVAAMGEAWSDFYGIEYTTPMGADPNGVYPTSQYFFQSWAQDSVRTRPYTTDITQNQLTFANLGRVIRYQEVHADGEIWMLALWEARAALIQQFGEAEGRRRIRQIVLDGVKLAPPRSTMVDMRDAILLADRVSFKGESQNQLWAAFAKRGLGALAFSTDADTTHVLPSFDLPSPKGSLAFYDAPLSAGDYIQVVLQDSNSQTDTVPVTFYTDAGDLETLVLRRQGSVYYGVIASSVNVTNINNGTVNAKVAGYVNAYYDDPDTGAGPGQVSATMQANKSYSAFLGTFTYPTFTRDQRIAPTTTGTLLTLPFEFPFYGRTYKTAYIHRNGLITLGGFPVQTAVTNGCTDYPALTNLPAIAPMWANLSINGVTQPNEGIYPSAQSDGSYAIMWIGETVSARPQPVNFATRLYPDGRIEVYYGTGNAEVGSATAPLGCGQVPVIGLSQGFGTTAQTFSVPMPMVNQRLTFEPPFSPQSAPTLIVESPKPGASATGVLSVRGVVYDEATTASSFYSVEGMVDGVKLGRSTARVARPDFCQTQNAPGCPNVGFTMDLDVSSLKPGEHKLQLRAANVRQGLVDSPEIAFTIGDAVAKLPVAKLESPANGDTVRGLMRVAGYAYFADLRVAAVDTIIDGITYGPTTYGVTRNDICSSLPAPAPPNCPAVGFVGSIDTTENTPPLTNGWHSIQIRVQDASGRFTLIPETPVLFQVQNAAVAAGGAITSVKSGDVVRGQIDISGYAYSAAARGITSVTIGVDGAYLYGTARINQRSAEVCAAQADLPGCPNIGFTGTLDTRLLSNGPHAIQVLARDSDGRLIFLPSPGSPVISVVVDNR